MIAVLFIGFVLFTVWVFGVSIGFDIKVKRNWLYIFSGILGWIVMGVGMNDLKTGVVIGLFFGLAGILAGPYMFKIR